MKNLIGLWPNLSRAYEVAKFSNLSIRIVFPPEYQAGFSDYENIKSFFKDIQFSKSGDLVVEILKPEKYNDNRGCQTLEDIKARIERGNQNKVPTTIKNPSSYDALMKGANRYGKLSLKDCELIEFLAQKIAQLSGCTEIYTEHLAEAIMYRFFMPDQPFCDAEEKKMCFGKGIEIANFELDPKDIQAAIKHLQFLYPKNI